MPRRPSKWQRPAPKNAWAGIAVLTAGLGSALVVRCRIDMPLAQLSSVLLAMLDERTVREQALGDGYRVSVRIVTLAEATAVQVPMSAVFPLPKRARSEQAQPTRILS